MSCAVCECPRRDEIDHALRRGVSIRATAKMFGLGKNTIFRHVRHVAEMDPKKGLTKGELDQRVRQAALREQICSLLEAAQAAGDFASASRFLRELNTLDKLTFDVAPSRRQQQDLRVCVVYESPSGEIVGPEAYIRDCVRALGWRDALRICLEAMCISDKVPERIKFGTEKFLEIILLEAETEAKSGIVAEDDSGNSRD